MRILYKHKYGRTEFFGDKPVNRVPTILCTFSMTRSGKKKARSSHIIRTPAGLLIGTEYDVRSEYDGALFAEYIRSDKHPLLQLILLIYNADHCLVQEV